MGSLSVWHWLIVLAIVSLVFGTGKLRSLGGDLGAAVKGFRQGVGEVEAASASLQNTAASVVGSESKSVVTDRI